jgi:phosphatidylglycerophosphate synthase
MTTRPLPPFSSLLKSRDVEDPINIYVHRPLAYAFVAAIYRTPITPNMVTFLSICVGMVSGAMFLTGTPTAMIAAGILLWTSAILDGADGFLARAKNLSSPFGRALDGSADMIVAAVTVIPAVIHLWFKHHDPMMIAMSVPIIALTTIHLSAYDYFKESFLRRTRVEKGGEGEDLDKAHERKQEAQERGRFIRFVYEGIFLPYLETQKKHIARIDPAAQREGKRVIVDERTAAIYRKHNLLPMRLWAIISLAPHAYLMSIAAMADRIDLYFWVRLVVMNAVFLLAVVLQRRATRRTQEELSAIGAADELVAVPA